MVGVPVQAEFIIQLLKPLLYSAHSCLQYTAHGCLHCFGVPIKEKAEEPKITELANAHTNGLVLWNINAFHRDF